MNEMIKRVAIAICESDPSFASPDLMVPWLRFTGAARAAIEAMREPTDDMAEAGLIYAIDDQEVANVWQAMLDEALK